MFRLLLHQRCKQIRHVLVQCHDCTRSICEPHPLAELNTHLQKRRVYASVSAISVVAVYVGLTLLWRRRVRKKPELVPPTKTICSLLLARTIESLSKLARSFGHVFLAERASDRRRVALKVLPCNDPKQRDAALAEYDILYNLRHDNLIRVRFDYQLGQSRGDDRQRWTRRGGSPGARNKRRMRKKQRASELRGRSTSNLSETESSLYEPLRYEDLDRSRDSAEGAPRRARSDTARSEMTDADSGREGDPSNVDPQAYGSFQQSVTFATAENVEQRDVDFISHCPRFICIVFDYFPDGDLRKFILNYGRPSVSSSNNYGTQQQQPSTPVRGSIGPASSTTNSSPLTRWASNLGRNSKNAASSPPSSIPPSSAVLIGNTSTGSIATDVPLPEAMIWSMGQQLCLLLRYVHCRKRRVWHRD